MKDSENSDILKAVESDARGSRMNQKNVMFLVIDACNADYLGPKDYKPTCSPFLDSLSKCSHTFSNVFSSGPYTEAAMMELMAGYRVLDHNSFIENLQFAPKTVLETFQDHGYETYSIIGCFSDYISFFRGLDHPAINAAPSYRNLYYGRIRFYRELYLNHALPEEKYQIMKDLMKHYFEGYEWFLNDYLNHGYATKFIVRPDLSEEDTQAKLNGILEEQRSFESDPDTYLDGMLKDGEEHRLFALEFGGNWVESEKMRNLINEMIDRYADTIDRMRRLQIRGNRKYIGGMVPNAFRQAGTALKMTGKLMAAHTMNMPRFKDAVGMPVLELSIYTDYVLNNVLKKDINYRKIKTGPCAKDMYDHFLDWYDTKYTHEKPFYAYIHIDDIHMNPVPFSFTEDRELLNREFAYMKQYVDSLDDRYHGNIMYDVGIHHVDEKIRLFTEELKKRGILENTVLIVTADHGYYYSYNHFRKDSIGNLYRENFHIPLIWHEPGQTVPTADSAFHAERDIPYTLIESLGMKPDESWQGKNLFTAEGRPCILSEYPGRGSPDMDLKQLYFGCYDDSWKIVVKAYLKEELNEQNITEIYDVRKDLFEGKNLKNGSYDRDHVQKLFEVVKKRFRELKQEYAGLLK